MWQAVARVVDPRGGRCIQMYDDTRPDESGEDRGDGDSTGPADTNHDGDVTSTHTDISGNPAFVIATVGHADAWLAVPPDAVVDTVASR